MLVNYSVKPVPMRPILSLSCESLTVFTVIIPVIKILGTLATRIFQHSILYDWYAVTPVVHTLCLCVCVCSWGIQRYAVFTWGWYLTKWCRFRLAAEAIGLEGTQSRGEQRDASLPQLWDQFSDQ